MGSNAAVNTLDRVKLGKLEGYLTQDYFNDISELEFRTDFKRDKIIEINGLNERRRSSVIIENTIYEDEIGMPKRRKGSKDSIQSMTNSRRQSRDEINMTRSRRSSSEILEEDEIEKEEETNTEMEEEEDEMLVQYLGAINILIWYYSGQSVSIPLVIQKIKNNKLQSRSLLITQINPNQKWMEYIKNIKESYQNPRINQSIDHKKESIKSSLFRVILNIHTTTNDIVDGTTVWTKNSPTCLPEKFELGFETNMELQTLNMIYNSKLFHEENIERMSSQLHNILLMTKDTGVDKEIGKLDLIMSPEEKYRILNEYAKGKVIKYQTTSSNSALELFEKQVIENPLRIAIEEGIDSKMIDYKTLSIEAQQVGRTLYTEHIPTNKNQFIAILLPQGSSYIKAMLGVMWCKKTFVPLDPTHPIERLKSILTDLNQPIIITTNGPHINGLSYEPTNILFIENLNQEPNNLNVQLPASIAPHDPNDLVYCIYTSGSTGVPKGLPIENHSVLNWIGWMIDEFNLTNADRSLVFSNPTFDMNISETLPFLSLGATLIIPPQHIRTNMNQLHKFVENKRISVMYLTTIIAETFFNLTQLKDMRWILFGGEIIKSIETTQLSKNLPFGVCSCYGLTEVTISQTSQKFHPGGVLTLSVGRPISNHNVYLLDENKQLVPAGVMGEVYIGGVGLSSIGYHNREEVNERVFIEWINCEKMCKTGDLGVWRYDGGLEILGRTDSQIKLRGFRVELGEVETCLLKHPSVQKAVVLYDPRYEILKAFIVRRPNTPQVQSHDMAQYLKHRLPIYAIPSTLTTLEQFPLTPNGKVDKKTLLETRNEDEILKPQTTTQIKMIEIWMGVLPSIDKNSISRNQTFFELGGNSIRIPKLMSLIKKSFPTVKIDLEHIFQNSSLEDLSGFVDEQLSDSISEEDESENEEYGRNLSPGQIVGRMTTKVQELLSILGTDDEEEVASINNSIFITHVATPIGLTLLLEAVMRPDINNVYCCIPASNDDKAFSHLLGLIENNMKPEALCGILKNNIIQKVKCWGGDISKLYFGWNNSEFKERSEKIDAVIHSTPLFSTETSQDVMGPTEQVFQFCLAAYPKLVSIHYISNLLVDNITNEDEVMEPIEQIGYNWMNEQILLFALDCGFPTTIYRLPQFGPHSTLPMSSINLLDKSTILTNILEFSMAIGTFPYDLMIAPIDTSAKHLLSYIVQQNGFNNGEITQMGFHLNLNQPLTLLNSNCLMPSSSKEWIECLKERLTKTSTQQNKEFEIIQEYINYGFNNKNSMKLSCGNRNEFEICDKKYIINYFKSITE